jgi:hypothetical protein
MKKLLAIICYRPSRNDRLVMAWFFLICGVLVVALSSLLGELVHGLEQFGFFAFMFVLMLSAHHRFIRRERDSHSKDTA